MQKIKLTPLIYKSFLLLCVCLSSIAWGCTEKEQGQVQSAEPDSLSLHFEQELLINDDGDISQEPVLASPSEIRTDKEGNIYIADSKLSAVQVFDADGNFLRSIGRAGEGPGEFSGSIAIEINNQQALITIDAINKRITHFSKTGEVLSNHNPAEGSVIWPQYFHQMDEGNYLILQKKREIPGIEDPKDLHRQSTMLHLYDSTFTHLSSFAHIDSLIESPGDFTKIYSSTTNAGHFWSSKEGAVWYAPPIYAGRLFKFRKEDNGWTLAQTLRGQLFPEEPLELDSDMEGTMAIVIYTDEGTKSGSAYLKSISLGIFEMKDGRLIHLSSQLKDGQRKTIAEVFDDEGTLKGIGQLKKFTFDKTVQEALIADIWKDNDDRFYIIDERGAPAVRIGRIEGLE